MDYNFTICKVLQQISKSNFRMPVRAEHQNIFTETSEMGESGILVRNQNRKPL